MNRIHRDQLVLACAAFGCAGFLVGMALGFVAAA